MKYHELIQWLNAAKNKSTLNQFNATKIDAIFQMLSKDDFNDKPDFYLDKIRTNLLHIIDNESKINKSSKTFLVVDQKTPGMIFESLDPSKPRARQEFLDSRETYLKEGPPESLISHAQKNLMAIKPIELDETESEAYQALIAELETIPDRSPNREDFILLLLEKEKNNESVNLSLKSISTILDTMKSMDELIDLQNVIIKKYDEVKDENKDLKLKGGVIDPDFNLPLMIKLFKTQLNQLSQKRFDKIEYAGELLGGIYKPISQFGSLLQNFNSAFLEKDKVTDFDKPTHKIAINKISEKLSTENFHPKDKSDNEKKYDEVIKGKQITALKSACQDLEKTVINKKQYDKLPMINDLKITLNQKKLDEFKEKFSQYQQQGKFETKSYFKKFVDKVCDIIPGLNKVRNLISPRKESAKEKFARSVTEVRGTFFSNKEKNEPSPTQNINAKKPKIK